MNLLEREHWIHSIKSLLRNNYLSYSDFSYSNMLGANLENATLTDVKWYYTICPDGTNSGKTGSCANTSI